MKATIITSYSKSSQEKLKTAHSDLIVIFQEVVKVFDNTIIYGYRNPELQLELYKKGRAFIKGIWIVVKPREVVTYKDGTDKKSKHNYNPSKAVDAVPYPIDWRDVKRMHYFAGFVMATAIRLKEEGKITHAIRWGGDWNKNTQVKDETFMDLAHYEII